MYNYVIVLMSSDPCQCGPSNCIMEARRHSTGRLYTSEEATEALKTWPEGFMAHKIRVESDTKI